MLLEYSASSEQTVLTKNKPYISLKKGLSLPTKQQPNVGNHLKLGEIPLKAVYSSPVLYPIIQHLLVYTARDTVYDHNLLSLTSDSKSNKVSFHTLYEVVKLLAGLKSS